MGKPQADGSVKVSFTLTNTGKRDGAQVVQAYVGRTQSGKVDRPEKELKGFKKIFLKAGTSETVSLTLPKEAFTYYDTFSKQFEVEPGEYNIMLGFSSRDIKCTQKIKLERDF